MKKQITEHREISEYDNYPIPESDPNITEDDKKRIIAEADAELEELYRNRKKYAFTKEELIELEKREALQ